ncbi:MAG: hypothetical protein IJS63_00040 [Bacteroidaceae bacterium]|nr:hypothetical protein [Bacteroidaceae bacterium]
MYKSELAKLAGVSASTFRRYLNTRREVLSRMGVTPRSKTLNPKAVRFVVEDYCIEVPEKMNKSSRLLTRVRQRPSTLPETVVPLHRDSTRHAA